MNCKNCTIWPLKPTKTSWTKQLEAKNYCKNPSCKHSTFGSPWESHRIRHGGSLAESRHQKFPEKRWVASCHPQESGTNFLVGFDDCDCYYILPLKRVDYETLTWWIWKSFTFSSSFATQSLSDWPDWWIMDLSFGSLKSLVVPPPSNSGKWRFSSGSPTKNEHNIK